MHEDAHLEMAFEDAVSNIEDHGFYIEEIPEAWEAGRDDAIAEHEAEQAAMQAEFEAEALLAQWDDDPNPYHGDYSEE